MKRFSSLFTYADMGGRRRMRRYVLAALLLLGLTLLVFAWSQHLRLRERGGVLGSAKPVDLAGVQVGDFSSLSEGDNSLRKGETNAAGETEDQLATPTACPTDPVNWAFHPVFPEYAYSRIEPPCVYEGLESAVAWLLLARLGYSKTEAADLLSFTEIPWKPVEQVKGLSNQGGPLEIPLIVEWPAHPEYRYWVVDGEGNPAVTASLRGCYRNQRVVGDRVELLNPDYPVLCVMALDYLSGWGVHQLGGVLTSVDGSNQPGTRVFSLFGYRGDGEWVYLGERSDLTLSIEDPERILTDRQQTAVANGVPIWDTAWLAAQFGFSMRPLPQDWQAQNDPEAIMTIGEELTRFVNDE